LLPVLEARVMLAGRDGVREWSFLTLHFSDFSTFQRVDTKVLEMVKT